VKRIFLLLVFGIGVIASDFVYLGNKTLGLYFKDSLFNFLQVKDFQFPEVKYYLSFHARNGVAGNTPVINYPDGWANFKFYKPAGVEAKLGIYTGPNATLRVNVKFRGDGNNIFDYINPSSVIYNQYKLKEEDIYQTNYNRGLAFKLANVGNIVLKDVDQTGWIYIGIVEDAVNWYSAAGSPEKTLLRLYYRLTLVDKEKFLSWLDLQQFNQKGLGNPIPSTSSLVVIPKIDENGEPIEEIVNFRIYEPERFRLSTELIPDGYFVQIGSGENDWVYYRPQSDSLYKMEGFLPNEKRIKWSSNIRTCFDSIRVEDDKIVFGEYNSEDCPLNDYSLLRDVANQQKTYSIFVRYGDSSDEWLLFSSSTSHIYKISFEGSSPWQDVTNCFKDVKIESNRIEVNANLPSLSKEICFTLDGKIFGNLNPSTSLEEVVQEESISSSISSVSSSMSSSERVPTYSYQHLDLSSLEDKEFSVASTQFIVIKLENGKFVWFDLEDKEVYLLIPINEIEYKRERITYCFDNIEFKEDKVKVGTVVECTSNSVSSSSSVFSSYYYQEENKEEYHLCEGEDGIFVQVPTSISCQDYFKSQSSSINSSCTSDSSLPVPCQ